MREELGETILLNETLGAPSARAMEKLFAKIDAEPARKPALSLNLGARVAEFFASLTPRTLAWSASAAAIAILLQAGLIAGIVHQGTRHRRRLRDRLGAEHRPGRRRLHASSASRRRRRPTTSPSSSKPTSCRSRPARCAGGLYKVRVAMTGLPKAELAGIVKKLQEDKVVGFIATTE